MVAMDLSTLEAPDLWAAVRAAAAGFRDGAAGTVARLCTAAGAPRLGWVAPPPWPEVERSLAAPRAALPPTVLLLGPRGWSCAARALCEAPPALDEPATAGPPRLIPLDSLGPAEFRRALAAGDAGGRLGCLAVSGSGTTLETARLAEAVGDRPVV